MKKIFLILGLAVAFAFTKNAIAKEVNTVQNIEITQEFLKANKNTPIVDIRLQTEWMQTGVIENSHLITFFNADGSYDEKAFLQALAKLGSKEDKIAIICRSGNRSNKAAEILAARGYKNIINLTGGIIRAKQNGILLKQLK